MLETRFVIKYSNLFDSEISQFLNSDLLRENIEARLWQKRDKIPLYDPFRETKWSHLEAKKPF